MRRTSFALLAFSVFIASSALAGTWFVATPANGGNDDNLGTLASPFATITKGISMLANPGDVLNVRAGTYNERLTIWSKNGTEADPIRVQAYNHEAAVVDVAGLGGTDAAVGISSSSYVRFDEFEVKNSPEAGIRVYNSHHIQVRWTTCTTARSSGSWPPRPAPARAAPRITSSSTATRCAATSSTTP